MQNIQNKRYKQTPGTHTGGLILSLDMSSAFDTIPRHHIAASLAEAGVEHGDIALIMEWLSASQYHFQHGNHSRSITTTRGVRQGCVLSPLLWACLTCYILRRIPSPLTLEDVQAYADDFILSRAFHTHREFQEAIRIVPLFMRHLREYGLHINTSKTVMLLRMATTSGKTASSRYIVNTKQGTFFRTPGLITEHIPVKQKHVYLGCVITLYDFETETLRHRLQVGRTQYQRMRPVLCSQKYLSLTRRVRLWNTCIWTTITYGLACCGIPGSSLQALQRMVTMQLRSITRQPSHITHVTTDDLYAGLGLSRPEVRLHEQCVSLCQRLVWLQGQLSQQDVTQRPQMLDQARHSEELVLDAAGRQRSLVRVSLNDSVP